MYALVDAHTSKKVFEAAPAAWNGGAESTARPATRPGGSTSRRVTTAGDYFILDETGNVRSRCFVIADAVYRDVLVQASVRMLYYQRDGIAKDAAHAGAGWVDGVAHPQDTQCGLY